jgi:cell division protein FtsB
MISNAEKKELIEKSDQNEFVERIAREYFDFAYPDEQIYIDISGS